MTDPAQTRSAPTAAPHATEETTTQLATHSRLRNGRGMDRAFDASLWMFVVFYAGLLIAMLWVIVAATDLAELRAALAEPAIIASTRLSLLSSTLAAIMSVWIAVPVGYILVRHDFPGKSILDAIIDIPIVLPPLVVGLCLLILFQTPVGRFFEEHVFGVTYEVPAVVLSQFVVACAFAVRTMRVTFEQIDPRYEQVALTLGCNRAAAFYRVLLPEARKGIVAAGTIAWARSLGEFGPILVFAGSTPFKTEVMPSTVFLELSYGNLKGALAVSILMIAIALIVLGFARLLGLQGGLRG